MTDLPEWFRLNGTWHVAEATQRTLCGMEAMEPRTPVASKAADDLPPDPCRACLLILWRDEVEEEQLDAHKHRGLELSGPLE